MTCIHNSQAEDKIGENLLNESNIPVQVGASPCHFPDERHLRLASPLSVYPPLQVYLAKEPGLVLENHTLPLLGFIRRGQEGDAAIEQTT